MANGKAVNTLRKVVEGENLAANALAVAIGKVKESDLQQLLSQIQTNHVANVEEAGAQIRTLGGKYPIPGLREKLQKGWEGIASAKDSKSALKLLQKKERDSLVTYKDLLKKAGDEQTMQILLRNMADVTQNVVQLSEKMGQLQGKRKRGRILGLPRFIWLAGIAGGGYYYWQQRNKNNAPTSPETASPASPSSVTPAPIKSDTIESSESPSSNSNS